MRINYKNRAYFLPDATTVLAHNVFSMLRLSWMGGSLSSCSGKEKENNTKLPIFVLLTLQISIALKRSPQLDPVDHQWKGNAKYDGKKELRQRILRWQSRKHQEFLPIWTTTTGQNLPDTTLLNKGLLYLTYIHNEYIWFNRRLSSPW